MKGSLTVEAAYIFSFCFLILGIICYLGVFEYNRTVLKMTAYECILRSMEEDYHSDDSLKEILLKRLGDALQERTLGMEDCKVVAKITATKVCVSLQGSQKVLQVPLEVTVLYERIFPERILRVKKGIVGQSYEGTIETGIE